MHTPLSRPRTDAQSAAALAALALAAVLGAIALGRSLAFLPGLVGADVALLQRVNDSATGPALAFAQVIDVGLGPAGAPWLGLALVLICAVLARSLRTGVRAGAILTVSWVVAESIKPIVGRVRPDPALILHHPVVDPVSASFPSGHTAFAAAWCAALALSLAPGRGRRAAWAAGALVVALVGWSRLAVGAHFPLDVLVSAALVPVLAMATARIIDSLLVRARQRAALRARAVPTTALTQTKEAAHARSARPGGRPSIAAARRG